MPLYLWTAKSKGLPDFPQDKGYQDRFRLEVFVGSKTTPPCEATVSYACLLTVRSDSNVAIGLRVDSATGLTGTHTDANWGAPRFYRGTYRATVRTVSAV
jgi:hypothetical protein